MKTLVPLKGGEINDFVLKDNSCWIDVDNLTVYIHKTDEGVIVDIYGKKDGKTLADEGPISSTYAFFNES